VWETARYEIRESIVRETGTKLPYQHITFYIRLRLSQVWLYILRHPLSVLARVAVTNKRCILSSDMLCKYSRIETSAVLAWGCNLPLILWEGRTARVNLEGLIKRELRWKMLRRRPKREEVTERWGKLHKQVLHNFYLSQNIVVVTRSRKMWWVGHVAIEGLLSGGDSFI
jgi:hypothetical protein